MSRSLLPGLALSIALAAAFHHVTLGAGTSCESLASLKLPNTTITFAQTVAAGTCPTDRARAVGGAAQGSRASHRFPPEERCNRSDAAVVPASTGR